MSWEWSVHESLVHVGDERPKPYWNWVCEGSQSSTGNVKANRHELESGNETRVTEKDNMCSSFQSLLRTRSSTVTEEHEIDRTENHKYELLVQEVVGIFYYMFGKAKEHVSREQRSQNFLKAWETNCGNLRQHGLELTKNAKKRFYRQMEHFDRQIREALEEYVEQGFSDGFVELLGALSSEEQNRIRNDRRVWNSITDECSEEAYEALLMTGHVEEEDALEEEEEEGEGCGEIDGFPIDVPEVDE